MYIYIRARENHKHFPKYATFVGENIIFFKTNTPCTPQSIAMIIYDVLIVIFRAYNVSLGVNVYKNDKCSYTMYIIYVYAYICIPEERGEEVFHPFIRAH